MVFPEMLSHPNIPKPMHGVNPRSIMGREEWDEFRLSVYEKHNGHCAACGVHKRDARKYQRLEAHEDYNIDYQNARVVVRDVQPLCHYCHSFIHSGLLRVNLGKGRVTQHECRSILKHGISILQGCGGRLFVVTEGLAESLGVDTSGVLILSPPAQIPSWDKWRMVWRGKEYPPKFKSFQAWKHHYARAG